MTFFTRFYCFVVRSSKLHSRRIFLSNEKIASINIYERIKYISANFLIFHNLHQCFVYQLKLIFSINISGARVQIVLRISGTFEGNFWELPGENYSEVKNCWFKGKCFIFFFFIYFRFVSG